ncbi:pyridoxamine 5'-phosphate oxidase family protein [Streptomyces sp. SID14478]|uniref:helix-turn-helix domain-containing protein n=1 Tax=Streptomyces sp. SID14478 TaxID=2706073 RepID=UPI001EF18884|nr:pyridoxamine 5'-phosphate oxidase family protein [Streptomyces sp. SID14478]
MTREAPQRSGHTDLGRRVAARRTSVGMSREELGHRCGANASYIVYLEEHAASAPVGTLVRVADALGVTVDDLTGASVDRVPGRVTARSDTALVGLDEAECRRLIGTHGVGRIAVLTKDGPGVFPVNYLVAGADIAFRTAAATPAAKAVDTEAAFEIDSIDDVTASGWSVLAVGCLTAVTDDRVLHRLDATAHSHPWAGGPRTRWMTLTPVRLTGRSVGPGHE